MLTRANRHMVENASAVLLSAFIAGDGVTDDTAGLQAAIDAADGKELLGEAGMEIRFTDTIDLPANLRWNLRGALLVPEMSDKNCFESASLVSTAYQVSSHARGNPAVTLSATPSGLAAGDLVMFDLVSTTDPEDERVEPCYRNVVSVAGSTVTLTSGPNLTYALNGGTLYLRKVSFKKRCIIENGEVDLAGYAQTSTTPAVFRAEGYDLIRLEDLTLHNGAQYPNGSVGHYTSVLFWARTIEVKGVREPNSNAYGQICSAGEAQSVLLENNFRDGDGFGLAVQKCDRARIVGNTLIGRWNEQGLSGSSIRGIKPHGCGALFVGENKVENYDSGIKIEDTPNCQLVGNNFARCRTAINQSNQSANLAGSETLVSCNVVRDTLDTDPSGVNSAAVFISNDSSVNTVVQGNIGARLTKDFIRLYADEGHVSGNKAREIGRTQASGTYYCVYVDSFSGASASDVGIVTENSVYGVAGQSGIKCVGKHASSGFTLANNYAFGTATVS